MLLLSTEHIRRDRHVAKGDLDEWHARRTIIQSEKHMSRKRLLALAVLAACIGTAAAQSANSRLTFQGRVVQSTCGAEHRVLGMERSHGCSEEDVRAIDVERMTPAAHAADSAMLDYFLERTKGDAKFALTRQYR